MYTFLKTLPFPPAERLWALEPDFQCEREKKAQIHAFFLSRSALLLLLFFLRAFALFFCFALASAKKAPAPTIACTVV
jgi:hypothetical protein